MPFKKGPAAWRRTVEYMNSFPLILKNKVKVCQVNYHETNEESDGLRRFVFWNLAAIQHKNPGVQCIQLKNLVTSPFIAFHTLDEKNRTDTILVNCYKRNDKEILEYCCKLVGKTVQDIEQQKNTNVANFGKNCSRYCMCLVEGQIACPRYKPLPKFMTGKYTLVKKDELEEIRKVKSDEEALKEYWTTK